MKDSSFQNQFLSDIKSNRKIIFKICHLYTDNIADFNDLYQETILQLWKSYSNFKGKSKISSWIYKVALNTALYQIRKEKVLIPLVSITSRHHNIIDISNHDQNDCFKKIRSLLDNLTEIERAIITLHLDSFSYEEISEIIGISMTNVSTKINRIKQKLKKMIHNKRS